MTTKELREWCDRVDAMPPCDTVRASELQAASRIMRAAADVAEVDRNNGDLWRQLDARLAEIGEHSPAALLQKKDELYERQTLALESIAASLSVQTVGSIAEAINGHLYTISEAVKK